MANNKPQKRRLTQQQYFLLCNWLKDNNEHLPLGCTYGDVAAMAGQSLDIDIAEDSISPAMKFLGLSLPRKEPQTPDEKIAILRKWVIHLWGVCYPTTDAPQELRDL